ncbi:non-histone chromosomal protein 6 [Eurytemora carolleeae]|uniref:non-histone chromosomal protein 6 n=1 Tax=Eurytemora carolleeae TaxID=1294199 RepID=UPI000C78D048|nr:non-histone chromosomal protein 6 [Eurytemora carolleeae]|eukprot:XP_023327641.1 non-histone chromosomal protein 6-like [Eurytemora affinis]
MMENDNISSSAQSTYGPGSVQDGVERRDDGGGSSPNLEHWMKRHITNNILGEAERDLKDALEHQKQRRALKKRMRMMEKDLNRPKKSLSAYNIFVQEAVRKIKDKEGGSETHRVLFAQAGAEWNGLEDSEKQEYYEKAAEQRLKHNEEMKAYEARLDAEYKK